MRNSAPVKQRLLAWQTVSYLTLLLRVISEYLLKVEFKFYEFGLTLRKHQQVYDALDGWLLIAFREMVPYNTMTVFLGFTDRIKESNPYADILDKTGAFLDKCL